MSDMYKWIDAVEKGMRVFECGQSVSVRSEIADVIGQVIDFFPESDIVCVRIGGESHMVPSHLVTNAPDDNRDGTLSPMSTVGDDSSNNEIDTGDQGMDEFEKWMSVVSEGSKGKPKKVVESSKCSCMGYDCLTCFPLNESELESELANHLKEADDTSYDEEIGLDDEQLDEDYQLDELGTCYGKDQELDEIDEMPNSETNEKIGKILHMQDMGMLNTNYSPDALASIGPEMLDRLYNRLVGEEQLNASMYDNTGPDYKPNMRRSGMYGVDAGIDGGIGEQYNKDSTNGDEDMRLSEFTATDAQYKKSIAEQEMEHDHTIIESDDDDQDESCDAVESCDDDDYEEMDEALSDMQSWMNVVFEGDDETKADKDYDGDGEIESEKDEHYGSVGNAIDKEEVDEDGMQWSDYFDNDREVGLPEPDETDYEYNMDDLEGNGDDAYDLGTMVSFDNDEHGGEIDFDDLEEPEDFGDNLRGAFVPSRNGPDGHYDSRVVDQRYRKERAARQGGQYSRPGYESATKHGPKINESTKAKISEGADPDVIKALKALFD